ncbi:cation:proton antiporter [Lacticaseibacillus thailandensis]|nr:cation:proton antiporter [Lacticaseibacillus thailandensis]
MPQLSMLIVMIAALMIPLFMARFKINGIPTAVAEIVVGILLGKTGLRFVTTTTDLTFLSSLGVIVLIFLSGMEINFELFVQKPRANRDGTVPRSPVFLAGSAFVGVVITALVLAVVLKMLGLFSDVMLATILFSTIALGVVIAALTEQELLSKPLGQTILLTAALGEIIPLLALTVYSTINGGHAARIWLVLLIFLAAIILLRRFKAVYQFFARIDKSTTQLDIRLAFFLIFVLVTIAENVGAENILGAFLAGIVMKLLRPSEVTRDKLTSIGYGFFIPIFFIMTGAKLNLRTMMGNPQALMLIPVFFVCFALAKLIPFFIFHQRFNARNSAAGAVLTSTTITLVIPTLTIARNLNAITSDQSGAFTLAAVLSCVIAPIVFNKLYRPQPEDEERTRVTFLGANILTVPVAQQLAKGMYDITMVTDSEKNYRTYNSQVNVKLLAALDDDALTQAGVFDTDILVLGYFDADRNYRIARMAVEHKVARVVARFETREAGDDHLEELAADGVELFNTFTVNASLLRGMIESPSTLKLLTDTEAGLYEVEVHNHRYTGKTLQSLPDIGAITVSRIYRNGHFVAPHGDTLIEPNDHLIFTGSKDAARTLRQQLGARN